MRVYSGAKGFGFLDRVGFRVKGGGDGLGAKGREFRDSGLRARD